MNLLTHDILSLPADWCPISDPLPEGWFTPITVRIKEIVKT